MPDRPSLPLWGRIALPMVVLVVALVIGSGVIHGSRQTLTQHASAIERVVRCPSCIDVSVADSDESTAIAVRHEIVKDLHEGRTTGQIEQTLVSQYGPTILLVAPGQRRVCPDLDHPDCAGRRGTGRGDHPLRPTFPTVRRAAGQPPPCRIRYDLRDGNASATFRIGQR